MSIANTLRERFMSKMAHRWRRAAEAETEIATLARRPLHAQA
jgi:hypothetical protein